MDKADIISLKRRGKSNREVSRITGFDRETVSKYWRECQQLETRLKESGADRHELQEALCQTPKYRVGERPRRKYTPEIERFLHGIVDEERLKSRLLGARHKQHMTNVQIYEKVVGAGYDISRATVNTALAKIRKRQKEVHIRQEYELGQRLEYDFGEVRLECGEGMKTYHMAVFCSPASGFRWMYLYTNQKKDVFLDSHVRFFEMMGGVYWEVVYDNMKNVVRKLIGKTDKELKAIFDAHWSDKPRRFVEIFIENKHLPLDEIITLFEGKTFVSRKVPALSIVRPITPVAAATTASLSGYSRLVMGGGVDVE